MTDQVKDLEYYQNNPGELPEDPEAIAALLGGEPDDEGNKDEPAAQSDKQVEPEAATGQEDEAKGDAGDKEEPAPISSKDGKHTIPYAVLTSERDKRRAAETAMQELQQRVADLEAGLASGSPGTTPQSTEVEALLSPESLAQITEDFPALNPLLDYVKSLETQHKALTSRFKEVEAAEIERQEAESLRQRSEVRAEVDANPHLRYWENQDPERWAAAMEADKQLRGLPINADLSLKDRFSKVVGVVEAIYGKSELPPEYQSQEKQQDLAAKVKDAVDGAGSIKPKTLSDMPGGVQPKTDPLENMLEQSPAALGAQLANMTPAQISALLAKAG
jgi:hypothetical protein